MQKKQEMESMMKQEKISHEITMNEENKKGLEVLREKKKKQKE